MQLLTVSIADTANPQVVNAIDLDFGPRALFVREPYLFVSYYYEGVQAFDLADPVRPASLGRYNTTGNSHGMYVDPEGYIYLADAHSLQILRLLVTGVEEGPPVRPRQGTATVARGAVRLGPGWGGAVRAYDAAGREAAALAVHDGAADLSGLRCGVYLLVGEDGRSARVVKVR
jgi:hypothetical protein